MTELAEELQRAWSVLARPQVSALASYPLTAIPLEDVRCGVDREGLRHLLLPADDRIHADSKPAVLSVSQGEYAFGSTGDARRYVDIACGATALNALFDDLIVDVLDRVVDATEAPGAAAVEVIAQWRQLFRNGGERGLSDRERRGLFAELAVLLALKASDDGLPLSTWRGPLREAHDFRLANNAIEVKAVGAENTTVTINGLEQMAPPTPAGSLSLLVISLDEGDDHGETLVEIVNRTERLFDRVEVARLLRRLRYSPGTDQSSERFSITNVLRVAVTSDVPCLTAAELASGSLASGVQRVRYDLELDTLTDFGDIVSMDELSFPSFPGV